MTEANRLKDDPPARGKNVLRPLVRRWMPEWVKSFRCEPADDIAGDQRLPERSTPEESKPEMPNNVHPLPGVQSASAQAVEQAKMIQLQHSESLLRAAVAEWSERSDSVTVDLDRARQQLEQAELRLVSAGEAVPGESDQTLTVLQESYQNFAMAVEMQAQKLSQAMQKVAALEQQRSLVCAEILARDPNTTATDCTDIGEDEHFKRAA